jgi:hypothetical protein
MRRQQANFKPLAAIVAVLALALCGSDEPSQEYKVKAAFIYNFAKFIEWPSGHFASDDSPFVIAIVGTDPFNGELDRALAGKKVGTHPVEARHFESAESVGRCEVLFIADNDDEAVAKIIATLSGKAVLTVGDGEHFDADGGAIRFFTEDGKMRFEINTDATDAAKLKISSKLLKLARIFKK